MRSGLIQSTHSSYNYLIYDEGNYSIPQPMTQTIDESITMFTTEQTLIGTTGHEGDTESVTTTVFEIL